LALGQPFTKLYLVIPSLNVPPAFRRRLRWGSVVNGTHGLSSSGSHHHGRQDEFADPVVLVRAD